jgi:hypothetical protein
LQFHPRAFAQLADRRYARIGSKVSTLGWLCGTELGVALLEPIGVGKIHSSTRELHQWPVVVAL